jgi:hypothetical protein
VEKQLKYQNIFLSMDKLLIKRSISSAPNLEELLHLLSQEELHSKWEKELEVRLVIKLEWNQNRLPTPELCL